ncbi:MAG: bifunctional 4-hydroxy-2-oxoglutarate aldolase/2-dehydro-3-deoxy-phosphogluconate aldolase, partial [Syntrophothermus sp.]
MKKAEVLEKVIKCGAVAVVRLQDSAKLIKVANALHEGGVSAIEITMTIPNAIKVIEQAARELDSEIIIGVGSVLNADTARDAINAGACYVVSPIFKREVIELVRSYDLPVMPGCFTPTEIQTAWEAGADVIKVFPADVLGIPFFKGVLAPMPHLKLMPTGGVTLTNADQWMKAGAVAVGVG